MNRPLTGTDRSFIAQALELAQGGRGRVSPNPLVGALLVRGEGVIGAGFHAELGGLHAERAALEDCRARGADPAGATLYVTLEPCAHQGRQPPCVEAILEAGIARVVIASDDPSERASGRGPNALRAAGVEVVFCAGEESEAARLLNQPFRKHALSGRPLVRLKMAMSLEGQTSTAVGDSPWISGAQSRRLVHRWRAESDAVGIGIGTALADDPLLTAREVAAARQPTRVVFDRAARLPLDSQLLGTIEVAPLVLISAPNAPGAAALRERGVEVIFAADIRAALGELGDRQITTLLLEGGPELAAAFAAAGEVDEARTFIAPILLGAAAARAPGKGRGGLDQDPGHGAAPAPARRVAVSTEVEAVGADTLITSRFKEW